MITFKLNAQSYQIPTTWEDVTFKQYIQLFDLKDDTIQLVSIFTGLEYDILKNAVIVGLDDILKALSFVNKKPEFPGSVSQCGPYQIPNNTKGQFNIQHESLAQFEDMRQIMRKIPANDIKEHTKAYGKYVAIYLQKIKNGEYKPLMVPEMEDEVENMPAFEVCSLGAFFFLKLWSLSTGTVSASPSTALTKTKTKQATKTSKKRSGQSRPSRKRQRR